MSRDVSQGLRLQPWHGDLSVHFTGSEFAKLLSRLLFGIRSGVGPLATGAFRIPFMESTERINRRPTLHPECERRKFVWGGIGVSSRLVNSAPDTGAWVMVGCSL